VRKPDSSTASASITGRRITCSTSDRSSRSASSLLCVLRVRIAICRGCCSPIARKARSSLSPAYPREPDTTSWAMSSAFTPSSAAAAKRPAEPVADHCRVHPGALCDVSDRHLLEAALGERDTGCLEDDFSAIRRACRTASTARMCRFAVPLPRCGPAGGGGTGIGSGLVMLRARQQVAPRGLGFLPGIRRPRGSRPGARAARSRCSRSGAGERVRAGSDRYAGWR
jgi:hypothetical protein